jgi:hypothetical protein
VPMASRTFCMVSATTARAPCVPAAKTYLLSGPELSAALAHRLQAGFEDVNQPSLDRAVAEPATPVVGLHLLEPPGSGSNASRWAKTTLPSTRPGSTTQPIIEAAGEVSEMQRTGGPVAGQHPVSARPSHSYRRARSCQEL